MIVACAVAVSNAAAMPSGFTLYTTSEIWLAMYDYQIGHFPPPFLVVPGYFMLTHMLSYTKSGVCFHCTLYILHCHYWITAVCSISNVGKYREIESE